MYELLDTAYWTLLDDLVMLESICKACNGPAVQGANHGLLSELIDLCTRLRTLVATTHKYFLRTLGSERAPILSCPTTLVHAYNHEVSRIVGSMSDVQCKVESEMLREPLGSFDPAVFGDLLADLRGHEVQLQRIMSACPAVANAMQCSQAGNSMCHMNSAILNFASTRVQSRTSMLLATTAAHGQVVTTY